MHSFNLDKIFGIFAFSIIFSKLRIAATAAVIMCKRWSCCLIYNWFAYMSTQISILQTRTKRLACLRIIIVLCLLLISPVIISSIFTIRARLLLIILSIATSMLSKCITSTLFMWMWITSMLPTTLTTSVSSIIVIITIIIAFITITIITVMTSVMIMILTILTRLDAATFTFVIIFIATVTSPITTRHW